MRLSVEVRVTLEDKPSPETNELALSWSVLCSAVVNTVGKTYDHPGERTVENIEILDVTMQTTTYGTEGGNYSQMSGYQQRNRCLRWLRQQLKSDDRDDWQEVIADAALTESESRMAELATAGAA